MNIKKLNEEIEKTLEPMYEMSMAWTERLDKRCCWVENPTGYANKYFKYLDGITYNKAERVARISMLRPEYLNHKDPDGKVNWVLNSKDKKLLVVLMNKKSRTFPNLTNWQLTLITYNQDNFGLYPDETINGFNKEEYPNAFDIDTPMPNYLEL